MVRVGRKTRRGHAGGVSPPTCGGRASARKPRPAGGRGDAVAYDDVGAEQVVGTRGLFGGRAGRCTAARPSSSDGAGTGLGWVEVLRERDVVVVDDCRRLQTTGDAGVQGRVAGQAAEDDGLSVARREQVAGDGAGPGRVVELHYERGDAGIRRGRRRRSCALSPAPAHGICLRIAPVSPVAGGLRYGLPTVRSHRPVTCWNGECRRGAHDDGIPPR